jgi:hypothetical protein
MLFLELLRAPSCFSILNSGGVGRREAVVDGTLVAKTIAITQDSPSAEEIQMSKKFFGLLSIALLAAIAGACSTTDNANANINANTAPAAVADTTRPGPDGSEITTHVDANGVKTETRVFHNNPRVAKVVVTTRDGRRTTTVYAPSGASKDLGDNIGDALDATGDSLAHAAGFVGDKAEDVAGEAKSGVKTAAEKTSDAAKTVGAKTTEGAKKVADETAEGAKKTGKAIKKAVTP